MSAIFALFGLGIALYIAKGRQRAHVTIDTKTDVTVVIFFPGAGNPSRTTVLEHAQIDVARERMFDESGTQTALPAGSSRPALEALRAALSG